MGLSTVARCSLSWTRGGGRRRQSLCPSADRRSLSRTGARRALVRLARVGASTTIKVEAATNRPVAAWSVDALDLTGRQARECYVEISLDTASVVADRTATLTIAVRKLPPNKVAVVGLRSTLCGQTHLWPVALVTR